MQIPTTENKVNLSTPSLYIYYYISYTVLCYWLTLVYVHKQIFTELKGSVAVSLHKARATSCHAHGIECTGAFIQLLHLFSYFQNLS